MAEIFEIGMVLCFGASWPFNVIRAYKARTAKGTSLLFTLLIEIGYISAIIGKFILISQHGTCDLLPQQKAGRKSRKSKRSESLKQNKSFLKAPLARQEVLLRYVRRMMICRRTAAAILCANTRRQAA